MGEWPTFLLPILDCQQDTADRDKMMLGALNILSGIISKSLYGIYDRRKIYAPLYNIIFGGFATKKGDKVKKYDQSQSKQRIATKAIAPIQVDVPLPCAREGKSSSTDRPRFIRS